MRDEKKRSKKRVAWMAPQQKRDAFPKRKAHKHAKGSCGKKLVGLLAPGVENAEMKWTRESRAAAAQHERDLGREAAAAAAERDADDAAAWLDEADEAAALACDEADEAAALACDEADEAALAWEEEAARLCEECEAAAAELDDASAATRQD